MTRPAWFGSMAARVFLLLLVGVSLAAVVAFSLSDLQKRSAERRDREQRLVERVADLAGVLSRAPATLRPALLGPGPEGARFAPGDMAPGAPDEDLTQRLYARLGAHAAPSAWTPAAETCRPTPPPPPGAPPSAPPARPPPEVRTAPPAPPPPDCRLVRFTLGDGERLRLIVGAGPRPAAPAGIRSFDAVTLTVLAIAVAGLAFLTARLTSAPLQRLAIAAGDLGRDLDRPPLAVEGPTEVRRAAEAFNRMQRELKQRQAERTHMLAAITHDLQTPLTRLRLRLDKVANPGLRAQLIADQAAMVELVHEGLDLVRAAEGDGEPLQELEIDSLLQSLCADAVDAGETVTIAALCGGVVLTRPQALRRCARNLLDNELKYAGSAELTATRDAQSVVLRVLDRGPGIPEAQLSTDFEPFIRLETSRSRDTGGAGLGLTIACLLAGKANAQLGLENRIGGGIDASLMFVL